MVIVKDPATGRTWPSPEAYVRDPRKYGGGGGSSGRTFREEFERLEAIKKEAARKAAELEAAKKAAELKAKLETQQAAELRTRQEAIVAEETRKRAATIDYWIEQGLSAGASRILAEKIRAGKYEEANKIIEGINKRRKAARIAKISKAAEEYHWEKYGKPFIEKRKEEIARKKWEKEHPGQAWISEKWTGFKEKFFRYGKKAQDISEPALEFPIGHYVSYIPPGMMPGIPYGFEPPLKVGLEQIKVKHLLGTPKTIIEAGAGLYGKWEKWRYEQMIKSLPEKWIGKYLPSPEQIEKIGAGKIEIGAYFTPARIPLLVSEVAYGLEKPSAEEIARERKRQYKLHKEIPLEEGYRYYTEKEFGKEFEKGIEESLRKGRLISGAVAGTILVTYGAVKGITWLKKPIEIKIKGGKVVSKFREIKQPFITEKGMFDISKYKIITKRGVIYREWTTRIRKILRFKPKKELISEPKYWITEPLIPRAVIRGRPYIAVTAKVGKKGLTYPRFFRITGDQKVITAAEFAKLPTRTKFALQKLVETEITGRPVALKHLPYFLKDPKIISMSRLEQYKLFAKPGKHITRAEMVSILKIKKSAIETPYKLYTAEIGWKDVTKPFARATGKVPTLTGEILELPPITLERKIPSVFKKIVDLAKKIKPTIKPEKLTQVKQLATAALKSVPKITKSVTKPMIPLVSAKVTETFLPSAKIVEKTIIKEKVSPAPRLKAESKVISMEKLILRVIPRLVPRVIPRVVPRMAQRPVLKVIPKVIPRVVPRTIPVPSIISYALPSIIQPKVALPFPTFFFYPAKRIKRFRMRGTEALMREPSIFMPGFTARAFRMKMGVSMKELTRLARVPEMAIGIRKIPVFALPTRKKRKKRRVQNNLNFLLRL